MGIEDKARKAINDNGRVRAIDDIFFSETQKRKFASGELTTGNMARDFVISQIGMIMPVFESAMKRLYDFFKQGDLVLIVDNNYHVPSVDDKLPSEMDDDNDKPKTNEPETLVTLIKPQIVRAYYACFLNGAVDFDNRRGTVVFPTEIYMTRDGSRDYWSQNQGPMAFGWMQMKQYGQGFGFMALKNQEAIDYFNKLCVKDDTYIAAVKTLSQNRQGSSFNSKVQKIKMKRAQVLSRLEELKMQEEEIVEGIERAIDRDYFDIQYCEQLNTVRHMIHEALKEAQRLNMHTSLPGVSNNQRDFVLDMAYQRSIYLRD